ncbi:glycoside hydrolase family 32 protein [Larkinella rosea]|uniref:beta-fructofuranosidase n=1 Tax=Larkinella rosea TaxID=2025312 RepID=A0A3P1BAC1_9BACT|nr:glycoside hydrolase family 32 protein [Larkinella rosea]RRA98020.1 glycoside hydrolase family 32 protein [Larkinella rosea]
MQNHATRHTVLGCLLTGILLSPSVSAQESRVSKVPFFTFGTTLEEQEKQLKTNPLLKRFKVSSQELAKDHHRPTYHYVSPEGIMNDPNGLCFWQGRWHMFYQGFPPEDPRVHWGHAVSTDLIHWRDLPYAIYPNPEDRVYSGSTFVEPNRVIAMYHGVGSGSMVATSSDPLLLNWSKVTGKPVIPIPKPGEKLPYNVFDPAIWKKGDQYYCVLAGQRPVGPGGKLIRALFLFRSPDLANWQYLHPFIENDGYGMVGDDGACPYFWPIGDKGKYILLHFSHMSGGKYMLGDYDQVNDKFIVTDGGNFNHGPMLPNGVHAPSAYPDGKGGIVTIFNVNEGKTDKTWGRIMSLPRLLTLDENGKLLQEPIGDLASLRSKKVTLAETALPANQEIVLPTVSGNALEMHAVIDPKNSPTIELNLLRSPGKEEYTRILFYKNGGFWDRSEVKNVQYSAISIDNSNASTLEGVRSRVPETASVLLKEGELVDLRIFVDKSIVEVFVNGRQCVAVRMYPGRNDSQGVSIRAHGSPATLKTLEAWQMENLFANP